MLLNEAVLNAFFGLFFSHSQRKRRLRIEESTKMDGELHQMEFGGEGGGILNLCTYNALSLDISSS